MTGKNLKSGDKVRWDSAGGSVEGHVEKKITSTTKIKGHVEGDLRQS